jgi:Na+/H+ antiporter NhaD/arsenite permease-like protein
MTADAWLASGIFVVTYALLAFEPFDRTLIALGGGLLVVALGVISQNEAFAAIDLNVLFLLVGMMVLGTAFAMTGFFEWVAVRSVRLSNGHPLRLLLILSTITAALSAFLPNVTTVIFVAPIMLSVSRRLGVSPIPYLVAMVLAANIGGTATLIGDPPNILIGSAAGLDFVDFALNLGPVTLVIFIAFAAIMATVFRNHLQVPDQRREAALEATEGVTIHDRRLLVRVSVVAALTLAGFIFGPALGLEAATVALLGASAVMLVGRLDPHEMLRGVDWSTVFFFVGLFVLVEGIVHVGIVSGFADAVARATQGDVGLASMGVLWFSAIASAVVDNVPFTATAIPVVHQLIGDGLASEPLWWSLALGACLGGNLTILGASANVVVANLSRRDGNPIGFFQFLRYGAAVVLVSLVISSIYVWLRYLS